MLVAWRMLTWSCFADEAEIEKACIEIFGSRVYLWIFLSSLDKHLPFSLNIFKNVWRWEPQPDLWGGQFSLSYSHPSHSSYTRRRHQAPLWPTPCNALPFVRTVTLSSRVCLYIFHIHFVGIHHCIISGRPCKIVDMSTSKTGKHGHAKVHLVAIDVSS